MAQLITLSIIFLVVLILKCSSLGFDSPGVYQLTEPVDHAEGPTWDARKNVLFYVDIHAGGVYSYNYYTTEVKNITLDGTVTPVITAENNDNLLFVGVNRSVVAVQWDGNNELGKQKVLTTVSDQFPESRMNDGKADRKGRLWWGTMGPENTSTEVLTPNEGVFYKIDKSLNPVVEISPVNISNGLAWTEDDTKLYYIDTPTLQVVQYDFDLEKGEISNRQVVFDVTNYPELAGHPDGMTIDTKGTLWVALYNGGSVINIDPATGALIRRIALPARDVTSVMFGGPDLDILFVTTSRISLSDAEKLYYPAAGSVFAVTNLNATGRVVFNADFDIDFD